MLSFLTFLPLIGALALLFLKDGQARLAKIVAMSFASATLVATVLGLVVPYLAHPPTYHFQFVERYQWLPALGIGYRLGVDGISMWLIALTSLMAVVGMAASLYVDRRPGLFMALLLALESFMIGAFASIDLVLFFTFFELTLFPMWALIAIWGGERRAYAGAKFFIVTFAGSIFMLIGIIALAYRVPGGPSFDITVIQRAVANGSLWAGAVEAEALIFWSFAIAFLVKAPSFPFHTWMPTTYAESPTVVPVISGVMVKLGTYGLLRFCLPFFPDVIRSQAPILMFLAVVGIVYGGVIAAIQPDFRRLMAYSSISHMGFMLLGIFSLTHDGLVGGAFQQLSHGVIAGGLIILLGFLYERRGSRLFKDYSGLKAQMPLFATLFLLLLLGSVGLPFTAGFTGEFLAMMGAFEASFTRAFGLNPAYAIIAGFGVVLSAAYLLYMFQQIFYGRNEIVENRRLRDILPWEAAIAAVLVLFVLWGGLYPSTFIKPMEASLQATRLMSLNDANERPVWADEDMEIAQNGALTRGGTVVSAPNLHLIAPIAPPREEARRARSDVAFLREARP